MNLSYSIAAFFVGSLTGLTGVGGGALMTPMLLLVGVPPLTAVGTDLLHAAISKSCAIPVYHKYSVIYRPAVVRLALGSFPGAALALWLLGVLAVNTAAMKRILFVVIGIALMLTALALLLHAPLQRHLPHSVTRSWKLPAKWRAPLTVAAGLILGALVTMSSVGAGAVGTMFIYLLYPQLTPIEVLATDVVHAVPLTLFAGLGHLRSGHMDWNLLASLLLGSLPGVVLFSRLGVQLPQRTMRPLMGTVLLLLGAGLMVRI